MLIKAPGRINLIGEHTDYNQGFVLPASIDKCFVYGLKKREDRRFNLQALDLKEDFHGNLDALQKTEHSWVNFIIGLLLQLKERGHQISGFDCAFTSNIPLGSGMSSSSGLECGFIAGMNALFDLGLSSWEMIDMSHQSNHTFLGVKGGILDQFSSFFGKENQCMLLDCKSREFSYMKMGLEEFRFVLFNTNVKHDHVSGDYNDRPTECRKAVELISKKHPEITSLRDVQNRMLEEVNLPQPLHQRVLFILEENQRVHQFTTALQEGNIDALGTLLNQSHIGLRDLYQVSCPELDLMVDLSLKEEGVLGSRMMGGGFGGCTINLIRKDRVDKVTESVLSEYQKQTGIVPEAYPVQISNGVELIDIKYS